MDNERAAPGSCRSIKPEDAFSPLNHPVFLHVHRPDAFDVIRWRSVAGFPGASLPRAGWHLGVTVFARLYLRCDTRAAVDEPGTGGLGTKRGGWVARILLRRQSNACASPSYDGSRWWMLFCRTQVRGERVCPSAGNPSRRRRRGWARNGDPPTGAFNEGFAASTTPPEPARLAPRLHPFH